MALLDPPPHNNPGERIVHVFIGVLLGWPAVIGEYLQDTIKGPLGNFLFLIFFLGQLLWLLWLLMLLGDL